MCNMVQDCEPALQGENAELLVQLQMSRHGIKASAVVTLGAGHLYPLPKRDTA